MTSSKKRITYAPTDRTDALKHVASDFMLEVFDSMPGDYLISDESSLRDFTLFGCSDTGEIWRRIATLYGITLDHVRSENLVDILEVIERGSRAH